MNNQNFIKLLKSTFPVMAAILIISIVMISGCSKKDEKVSPQEKAPVKVVLDTIKVQDFYPHVQSVGIIESKHSTVLAFLQGGYLLFAGYDMGDYVNKGDTLAALDIRALQADLDRAEAALSKAKRDYVRAKELCESEVVPNETLENAETGLKSAEAMYSAAQFALDHGHIVAPFSGNITDRFMEPGVIVPPGAPVYGLVDLKYLETSAGISESMINLIKTGDKAKISLMAGSESKVMGKVTATPSAGDPTAGILPVKIEFRNPGDWYPGMAVRVDIASGILEKRTMIPAEGVLVSSEGEAYCYKYRPETGEVVKTDIQLGQPYGNMIELISGLNPGDRIVVKGVNKIRDGEKVILQSETEAEDVQ